MTARSDMAQIAYGFLSDVGRKRQTNQDSYAVLSRADLDERLDGLFVVADGMGGARGGEVASRIVVQSLPEAVVDGALRLRPGTPVDTDRLLYDAIARANHNVYTRKVENPDLRGMGTTCVAAIVNAGHLTVGNVGDSRIYLLRQGLLTQVTEDHSEVFEQVKAGQMTREEARTSKFRNRITRFIGAGPDVEPDVASWPLEEGDVVLICSDGLTTELKDTQIARILATTPEPQAICERLVSAALQQGGSDNVTVVVIRYGAYIPLDLPAPADDEEPDTDPDARWRKGQDRSASDRSERHGTRERSGGWQTLTLVALASALILSLVANYLLWTGVIKLKPVAKPAPGVEMPPPPPKPPAFADRAKAMVVYREQPLMDNILQVTPEGKLLTVTATGDIILIAPDGQAHSISSVSDKLFNTPITRKGQKQDEEAASSDVVLDAQGNRYQIRPGTRWIEQLTPSGTKINSSIGKGTLMGPTRLVVAPQTGDIYVIDNHLLKRISAQRR